MNNVKLMLDCLFHSSTRFIFYFSYVLYFVAHEKVPPGLYGDWDVRVWWTGMVGCVE